MSAGGTTPKGALKFSASRSVKSVLTSFGPWNVILDVNEMFHKHFDKKRTYSSRIPCLQILFHYATLWFFLLCVR